METGAYEFLKNARIDRFDVLCPRYYDVWQGEVQVLGEQARLCAEDAGVEAKYNQRCLGQETEGDKRLYSFETWGEFSDHWAQTVNPLRWVELQRLDIRIECDIDPEKLTGLYGHVSKVGKYGRNVNLFDSREREKKEGRHAGGKGISIGSHKSDRRLVIYKRKGEKGAIELQLSGRTLSKLVAAVVEALKASGGEGNVYERTLQLARAALEKMAREAGFESAYALVRSVSSDAPEAPPTDFLVEAPRQMLLQGFLSLPREEQSKALADISAEFFKAEVEGQ